MLLTFHRIPRTALALLTLCCITGVAALAQQSGDPLPAAPSAAQAEQQKSTKDKSAEEKEILRKEQSERIAGVLPAFGTTNRMDAPALTPGEKFHLMRKSAFDWAPFVTTALQAGISQAENNFPGYGQGAQGYGKRYGAAFADQVSSQFFSNFFYPTLLKHDPRYFRLGEGTVGHRAWYSLKQEFVCHTDAGGRSFNWSNVLGAFSSGGVSNLYYPESDRGASLTFSRSAVAIAYGSLGGLISEFYPDVQRKLFHKHAKAAPAK